MLSTFLSQWPRRCHAPRLVLPIGLTSAFLHKARPLLPSHVAASDPTSGTSAHRCHRFGDGTSSATRPLVAQSLVCCNDLLNPQPVADVFLAVAFACPGRDLTSRRSATKLTDVDAHSHVSPQAYTQRMRTFWLRSHEIDDSTTSASAASSAEGRWGVRTTTALLKVRGSEKPSQLRCQNRCDLYRSMELKFSWAWMPFGEEI